MDGWNDEERKKYICGCILGEMDRLVSRWMEEEMGE